MEEAEATLAMPLASGVYGRSAIEEAAATLVTFSMPLAAVVLDLHCYEECDV